MEPNQYLDFLKQSCANERDLMKVSLSDQIDAGDRLIAQKAAGEVINAASLLIREQERGNPT